MLIICDIVSTHAGRYNVVFAWSPDQIFVILAQVYCNLPHHLAMDIIATYSGFQIFVILAQLMLVGLVDFCDILDYSSNPIASHKHLILHRTSTRSRITRVDCQNFVLQVYLLISAQPCSCFLLWAAGLDLEIMTYGAL